MTYPATQTYWLEPTDKVALGLRRYSHGDGGHDCAHGYHDALVYTNRGPVILDDRGHMLTQRTAAHDDPRWPTTCRRCDYLFTDADEWQDWQERIWRRPDTGQDFVLHTSAGADVLGAPSAPPGATWNAYWMPFSIGPDGICLMVRCPNGKDWMVDSEASNCTRKGQKHQCWVRHGDPRECRVTVDKNGDTCAAGAGSILAGDYHGFLQSGVLTAG